MAPPKTFVRSMGRPGLIGDGQGDDGERFVHLKKVDVFHLPADLVEQFLEGADGRGGEPLGLLAVDRRAHDPSDGFQAEFIAGSRGSRP